MRAGRRFRTDYLEVRSADSLLSHVRIGVLVGKHGHEIVVRNRLRRRLRELVRTRLLQRITDGDVILRALPSAYAASFDQLRHDVDRIGETLTGSRA